MLFISGHYHRRLKEDRGRFNCPQCKGTQSFTLCRTWNYYHIYFIPILKQELVAENVVCDRCSCAFSITVLSGTAKSVNASFGANQEGGESFIDNFGNVVELTEAAGEEIKRRFAAGKFGPETVVRVAPDCVAPNQVSVLFDFPLADGRDWIGQSRGIPIVVNRQDAQGLQGFKIDFRHGAFVRS